jgi:cytochrome c553
LTGINPPTRPVPHNAGLVLNEALGDCGNSVFSSMTRNWLSIGRILSLATAMLVPPASQAAAPAGDTGKEINNVCAACHGDFGQGGKRGEYPRIAGQRPAYLKDQLKSFRARKRINIPMYPYTQERELSDEDIEAVSAYLSAIELPTRPPAFKETDDALTRLLAMDKVMVVPRTEGDLDNGRKIFQKECASCHAKDGRGRGKFPMLTGQYTNYLKKQADAYVKGERPHDEDGATGILNTLKEQDILDILAYLTTLQEK